mmetsp:Transcript_3184/g.4849  ORF Transcript_3184/g.4849 Transcript_3184/m.4849 type:complete len:121 (+) Transcript_3184:217-579(+)
MSTFLRRFPNDLVERQVRYTNYNWRGVLKELTFRPEYAYGRWNLKAANKVVEFLKQQRCIKVYYSPFAARLAVDLTTWQLAFDQLRNELQRFSIAFRLPHDLKETDFFGEEYLAYCRDFN